MAHNAIKMTVPQVEAALDSEPGAAGAPVHVGELPELPGSGGGTGPGGKAGRSC